MSEMSISLGIISITLFSIAWDQTVCRFFKQFVPDISIEKRLIYCSNIHAIVSVILHIFHLIFGFSEIAYSLVLGFSTGYALNDMFWISRYSSEKNKTEYMIHHSMLALGCIYCMFNQDFSEIASRAFMAEIVVPLMNIIKHDPHCEKSIKRCFVVSYIFTRPVMFTNLSLRIWDNFGFCWPLVIMSTLTGINFYWSEILVRRAIQENLFHLDIFTSKPVMRTRTKSKKID